MSFHEDEVLMNALAPLNEVDPITRRRRPRHRRRSAFMVLAALIALVAAGSAAVAGSWGPLSRIGSVDRPSKSSDVLPPSVIEQLKGDQQPAGTGVDPIGERLIDKARLLGTLPSGRQVYAVPTSKAKLCIVVAASAESCGDPLSSASPVTFTVDETGPGVPPVVWGATMNGVKSVAFRIGSTPVTVSVHGNFFAWQGTPDEAQAVVAPGKVTLTNGNTAPITG